MDGIRIEIVKKVKKTANIYEYNLKLSEGHKWYIGRQVLTNPIDINERIKFQAKFMATNENTLYFAKFTKKQKDDQLDYQIEHSICLKQQTLKAVEYYYADNTWQLSTGTENNIQAPNNTYSYSFAIHLVPAATPYAAIYEDTNFTDVELRASNGSIFMHRVIAAACSPFFKTLFRGSWRETAKGIIDIPDTSVATLQCLKKYMYLGVLSESADLKELLHLASCYILTDLEMRCIYQLTTQATLETICELMEYAGHHKLSNFTTMMLRMIQHGELDASEITLKKYNIV